MGHRISRKIRVNIFYYIEFLGISLAQTPKINIGGKQIYFLYRFHPSKAKRTRGVTGCGRTRNRKITKICELKELSG